MDTSLNSWDPLKPNWRKLGFQNSCNHPYTVLGFDALTKYPFPFSVKNDDKPSKQGTLPLAIENV